MTCWAMVALATTAGAQGRPAAASSAADRIDVGLADPTDVPVTFPTSSVIRPRSKPPLLPEITAIIDRPCRIGKDPAGKWYTIKDPRVGYLRLLPCRLLETVEDIRAGSPTADFNLTGQVHRYRGRYYMLLQRAELVPSPAMAAAGGKPVPTDDGAGRTSADSIVPDAAAAPQPPISTAPAKPKDVSADDVAQELFGKVPARPIVPTEAIRAPGTAAPHETPAEPVPSGAPAGKPLRPGPGMIVINRSARILRQQGSRWFLLAFEADNTLREPPMRILPTSKLETMERLLDGGNTSGAVFNVSGEVYRYRGADYILLRSVTKRRDMGQF